MRQAAREATDDEADLVARARNGEVAAFESLYRAHVGRVHGLCRRMARRPDAAEDLTQEVFVSAWRSLPAFEGRSGFGTWLHRIAVNAVLAQERSPRGRGEVSLTDEEGEQMEIEVEDAMDAATPIDLERAIATLPPGARNVMVLHGIHGYSHDEVAEMLGVAVGTCKAQLHRARQLLRDRMQMEGHA